MAPAALERHRVSLAGYHDLRGRPAFKIDLQRVDDRWYCYLGHFWHQGWTVLDVTDPTDPAFVRFVEGPDNTFTGQVQVADGLLVTALERPLGWGHVDHPPDPDGPFEESAILWDVGTDPTDPRPVGRYERGGDGTHRNFYAGGDYAYMAVKLPGYTGRLLEIVDVSDPTDPEPVSKWWWPGQHPDDGEPLDATYCFHGPAYVRDATAFLSYGSIGAVVLDVSDPTAPELLSRIDFGDLGSWLGTHSAIPLPDRDLLVVNDEAILEGSPLEADGDPINFVALVEISDLGPGGFEGQRRTGPKVVSTLPTPRPAGDLPYDTYAEKPGRFGPHNQHHFREDGTRLRSSDHVVMTWFNAGLRIFDVADPLAPTEVAHYVPEDPTNRVGVKPESGLVTQFEDVVVDPRGYVYCSDKNHGLFVLETDVL